MDTYMRKRAFICLLVVVLAGMLGATLSWEVAFADSSSSLTAGSVNDGSTKGGDKAAHEDGWEQDGDVWHYWKNGEQVKGAWIDTKQVPTGMDSPATNIHRYWIDCDGNLAVNRLINPDTERDAGEDAYFAYAGKYGHLVAGKIKEVGAQKTKIYLARRSTERPGELESGNKYGILRTDAYDGGTERCYYINPSTHSAVVRNDVSKAVPVKVKGYGWVFPCYEGGYLLAGAKKIVGKRVYLANENGRLEDGGKDHVFSSTKYDKGKKRYYYINPKTHSAVVSKKPVMAEGYGWVLPCNKGGYLLTGQKKIVGIRVYLAKKNGKLETGNVRVNGKLTGIVRTKKYDKGTLRYYYISPKTHSAVVRNYAMKAEGFGWVLPCNKGGYLATGRKVIGDKVFLARSNGKLEVGNKLGILDTNRYDPNGVSRRYYINTKTHSITYGRPVLAEGFGYVYAPNSMGYILRGITRADDEHVILADNRGRICNSRGWVVASEYTGGLERFWLEPTKNNSKVLGARTGYFYADGGLHLGQDNGSVLREQYHLYDNTYFWVDNDGNFNEDDVVTNMYRRAQGYWSPSEYLLMVDIDDPKVMVFEGYEGNWQVKFIWDCCTGHPDTPTVQGTFAVGSKGYSFGEGNGYSCYYYTQITGDYLFHTRLYHPYSWEFKDDTMGIRCSHGCVRMYTDDAYWIWTNVPSGTTVACIS